MERYEGNVECATAEEHTAAEYPKQLILSSLLPNGPSGWCAAGQGTARVLFPHRSGGPVSEEHKEPTDPAACSTLSHPLRGSLSAAGAAQDCGNLHICRLHSGQARRCLQSAHHPQCCGVHYTHSAAEYRTKRSTGHTRAEGIRRHLHGCASAQKAVALCDALSCPRSQGASLAVPVYLFLCVFESQVLLESLPHKVALDKLRLDFARELTLMFQEPSVALETCIRLLDYLGQLPVDKSNPSGASGGGSSSLLSTDSIEWQAKMKSANPGNLLPHYQALILQTLAFVDVISRALQAASGNSSLEKYWRVLSNHAQDVLDNAIGMLAPEYFLNVINDLLEHPLIQVRIKVLEPI
ncbi:blast:HEAT repeat-containing protein 1 homolog [Drosophila guanche]|uniref:HEAT repeat-containing protein 1 n=1 Tax=Drosophila guanche TaxID=7266 RepID=A0A3B0K987_DROGU|nr:blast:HEAT repeat-containing protein 1 homolog [Drosophila guanche]